MIVDTTLVVLRPDMFEFIHHSAVREQHQNGTHCFNTRVSTVIVLAEEQQMTYYEVNHSCQAQDRFRRRSSLVASNETWFSEA
jgi:hypothetical protein